MAENASTDASTSSGGNNNNNNNTTLTAQAQLPTMTNPFYVNPNEALVFPIKLTGTNNYNQWSRTVRVALKSKNKMGFINGIIPIPDSLHASYPAWEQSNTSVLFMILGSLHPSLVDSISSMENARVVWNDLKQRFGQADNMRISDLQTVVYTSKQGNKSVNEFYTELKSYWEELNQFLPIPGCLCGDIQARTVPCVTEVVIKWYRDNEYVMRFLKGLNDSYEGVRTNLFMMSPLPPMETAFHFAIQHERKLSAKANQESAVESVALLPPSGSQGKGKETPKGNLFCRYCKRDNHVIADCYRLKRKNKEA
ncbi:unnamed protein product [Linum trigynum]|uniref:Retrotransposon Copia-like N-terminal domain-containing protein n=1 Tax=Linum trigynum TaxID=586398 RepID=A0AAV2DEC6_9ROSI